MRSSTMLISLLPYWLNALVVQNSNLLLWLSGGLFLAFAVIVWQYQRLRLLFDAGLQQYSELQQDHQKISQEKELLRSRSLQKQADHQGLQHDLGAQRKKTVAAQEELRQLKLLLKEEQKRRLEIENKRPAFLEIASEKNKPEPAVLPTASHFAASTDDKPSTPVLKESASRGDLPAPAVVAVHPSVEALEAEKVIWKRSEEGLLQEVAFLQKHLKQAQDDKAKHADDMKSMRRRLEDLRRLYLMSKNQISLLEDKLRIVGRQHYEAISDLAALKGEVIPPSMIAKKKDLQVKKPEKYAHASSSPITAVPPQTAL